VSILMRREVEQPVPHGHAVGIDVGIARFATLSDGTFVAPLNSFKKHEQRLAKYQRRMSRKTKFSNNRKKAKARVQRIHARIANARNDFLNKTSTTISQNHALVCIEDLRIGSMSKSSAGTSELPGKKVAQKSGLNKAILDQGWFEFRRQLEYKTAWRGGFTVAVPAPIRAKPARPAATWRRITARLRRSLPASRASTRTTPIMSVRSTF
jgi:putative transposase